jgi:hypothetical protein
VEVSLIRRIASLFFILAFMASAQAHAEAAGSMLLPKAIHAGGMMGIAKSAPEGVCKDCSKHGSFAKADCAALCAPIQAIEECLFAPTPVARDMAWTWASEPGSTRSTAPEPIPPRS